MLLLNVSLTLIKDDSLHPLVIFSNQQPMKAFPSLSTGSHDSAILLARPQLDFPVHHRLFRSPSLSVSLFIDYPDKDIMP